MTICQQSPDQLLFLNNIFCKIKQLCVLKMLLASYCTKQFTIMSRTRIYRVALERRLYSIIWDVSRRFCPISVFSPTYNVQQEALQYPSTPTLHNRAGGGKRTHLLLGLVWRFRQWWLEVYGRLRWDHGRLSSFPASQTMLNRRLKSVIVQCRSKPGLLCV